MKLKPNASPFALVLLCVLGLHLLSHALVLPGLEFARMQAAACDQPVATDLLTAPEGEETGPDHVKPPKQPCFDYSTFLTPARSLPAYQPQVCGLCSRDRQQPPPEVYLEPSVPPHPA